MWEVSAASPHIVIQFYQQKCWFNGDWTNKYDLMGYVFAPNSTQQKKHQKAGKSGATSKFHRRWVVIMGPIVTEYSWDNGIIGKKISGAASESENSWNLGRFSKRCLTIRVRNGRRFLEEIVYNIVCIWVFSNNIWVFGRNHLLYVK